MTIYNLLHALKSFCEEAVSEIVLPTSRQKDDIKIVERSCEVHLMRLPNSRDAKKKAPYIIIQFVTGDDKRGGVPESNAALRFIFCIYNENEEEGALQLIEVMDAVRKGLLQTVVIGECFRLDEEIGISRLIYTDDTAPYYAGEMSATFILPEIKRKGIRNEYI